jgi:hypothetical protein
MREQAEGVALPPRNWLSTVCDISATGHEFTFTPVEWAAPNHSVSLRKWYDLASFYAPVTELGYVPVAVLGGDQKVGSGNG